MIRNLCLKTRLGIRSLLITSDFSIKGQNNIKQEKLFRNLTTSNNNLFETKH